MSAFPFSNSFRTPSAGSMSQQEEPHCELIDNLSCCLGSRAISLARTKSATRKSQEQKQCLSLTILNLAEPEHPLKCHASPTSVLLTTVSGEVSLQTERAESVKPISECKCTAPQASKATTAWCSTVGSGNCSLISLWKCARRTRTSAVMSILNHGLLMQYEVSLWHCCSGSYLDDTGCLRQLAHGLANTDMHKCTPPCI